MKKRILIISAEVWRPESDGGNVLTNLFQGLKDEFEFAQIYCNSQKPYNNICKRYFQLSESEMFRSLLGRKSFGKELSYNVFPSELKENSFSVDIASSGFLAKLKGLHLPVFQTIRELLWYISYWKTNDLKKFILDYNPDIVFAPMYGASYMLRLDRFVASLLNKKLVSYVSDDHLTFRQWSLSPIYWMNRLILRCSVIKTSKCYSSLFTMTEEQANEYMPILKVPMPILKKCGDFSISCPVKKTVSSPIKIVYGGNIIYNRYKTLNAIMKALQQINKDEVKIQMFIYTQNPINSKMKNLLHDGRSSFLMGKVSTIELAEIYKESDIALHVESFERKQRLLTRLSFSTKIIDLLHSGCCVLAICWEESSPYKYLKKEDAAICISSLKSIDGTLNYLVANPSEILTYATKAWDCGKRNHDIIKVREQLSKFLMMN